MKRIYILLVILIIILAVFLRFSNLKERGVFGWDEGYYLMQGQFVYSGVKNAFSIKEGIKNGQSLQILYDKHIEGTFLSTPKPLVPPVIAASGVLTGGIKDYTANYASAFFGVLSVMLLGFLLYRRCGIEAGIVGLALFATMEYHIFITRSSYPESIPIFLLLCLIYFLSRFNENNKNIHLWLSAMTIALAVGYNYRFVMALFLFWAGVIINSAVNKEKDYRNCLKFIITSLFCFAVLAFLFEIPYLLLRAFSRLPHSASDAGGNAIPIQSYFQMLFGWLGPRTSTNLSGANGFSLYQIKNLWKYSGPVFMTGFMFGIYAMLRKKPKLIETVVLLFAVVPVLFLSLESLTGRKRALSIAIPFIAWVSSAGINSFFNLMTSKLIPKLRLYAFLGLVTAILLAGSARSIDSINLRSKAKEACGFLNDKNAKYYSTNWGVTSFYSTRHNSLYPFPKNVNEMRTAYKRGINYFYIDDIRHTGIPEFIRKKMFSVKPVKTYYNPDYFHDTNISRMATPDSDELEKEDQLPYVYIFRIFDFIN